MPLADDDRVVSCRGFVRNALLLLLPGRLGDAVGEPTNLQINPPRSRSRSRTCVSELQVNSKKHVGPKKESLHNKRKVTFKQDGPHVLPRQAGHYGQQNYLRQYDMPYIKYYLGTQCNSGYSMEG